MLIYLHCQLDVSLELPDGTTFVFDIDLCDSIIPNECKTAINKTNVEIKLKKVRVAQWATLEAKPGSFVNPWPDTSSAHRLLHTMPAHLTRLIPQMQTSMSILAHRKKGSTGTSWHKKPKRTSSRVMPPSTRSSRTSMLAQAMISGAP